jgi:hypothetical protein
LFLDEAKPGPQLFDLLSRGGDPVAEPMILRLELGAPLPEQRDISGRHRWDPPGGLFHLALRLEAATPPPGQLRFQRLGRAFERRERRLKISGG